MSNQSSDKKTEPKQRKPYEKPRVTSDDEFETLALSCVKAFPACSDFAQQS